MSAAKSAKSQVDVRSRAKSVLATLERLSGSSNPDKDQTRYLCHKLLQLVNDQETSKKDVTSKAGLDIILLTLESCSDQATCLALVSTLAEIANGGNSAIKRLVNHDATRVLLHTLSYIGAELDWRLLSAIIHLLSKIGPKDRRFALRARLTGSLSMVLTAVRSSHNHTSHARLLPAALSVLKLCVFNSSTNASLLGRAGAVNVIHRIVCSLSRKQALPLKNAVATLNLLVRLSKANASRAINLGIIAHLLTMHQDYHRSDFKYNRHIPIRKSVLNTIKNITLLKGGRKAFSDASGLLLLYNSCKDYIDVTYNNKSMESLLVVAIMVVRRCQPKSKLPVANSRCTFQYELPGGRDRSDSMDSVELFDESDDDFDENEEILSNDGLDDGGETTQTKRRGSSNSTSKCSTTSETSKDQTKPKYPTRSHDDLKMYEAFFPELIEFPFPAEDDNWDDRFHNRPHTSGEVEGTSMWRAKVHQSLPDLARLNPALPHVRLKHGEVNSNSWETPCNVTSISNNLGGLGISDRYSANEHTKDICGSSFGGIEGARSNLYSRSTQKSSSDALASNHSPGDDVVIGMLKQRITAWSRKRPTTREETAEKSLVLPHILSSSSTNTYSCADAYPIDDLSADHRDIIEHIQRLAESTKSVKETINRLSYADAWGSAPVSKAEPQVNKKSVQRLIKLKVLEDVARVLFPDQLVNKLVFSSEKTCEKNAIPRFENGQIFTCDVHVPSRGGAQSDNHALASEECLHKNSVDQENRALTMPQLFSMLHTDADANVKTGVAPPLEIDSSSTTVSDDTWPGVYWGNNELENALSEQTLSDTALNKAANSQVTKTPSTTKPPLVDMPTSLKFDSHFESGNLRSAVQVRDFEYDLVLNPDCNSNHHFQWFYFEVTRMKTGQPYRFNIVNCEKKGSIINEGMQPVMYSMSAAKLGRPYWSRVGRETCYYRNHFLRNHMSAGALKNRTYFTLTFTVTFQHANDTCYLAYHYPYTFTKLQLDLQHFTRDIDSSMMYVRQQTFCHTLAGNPVPVITITGLPTSDGTCSARDAIAEMRSRPYIFLTARVHPGESNASWTMRGTLRLLLTPPPSGHGQEDETLAAVADELRRSYIFKIVPMLNPDGVINGHHRCSLSGEDLNRTWSDPNPHLFPTIYHTKGLLQYLQSIQKIPLVYCDYHGHSRKMNVFLYGCSHRESIAAGESGSVVDGPDDTGYKTLPKLLNHFAPSFSLKNCSFVVERAKTSTARVVVWKEIGITRSYTMESSYCGCDQGMLRGKQIGTSDLEVMGSKFCEVLLHLKARNKTRGLPVFDSDDETNEKADVTSQLDHENGDHASPGCPVNSDAELTPDDDISTLDEAYGVTPGQLYDERRSLFKYMMDTRDQPCASNTDMSLWRYDPKSSAANQIQRPNTVAGCVPRSGKSSDLNSPLTSFLRQPSPTREAPLTVSSNPKQGYDRLKPEQAMTASNPKLIPLPVITARVSPVTGRVLSYEYAHDEISTTAPRPFESGLVLRKAPLEPLKNDVTDDVSSTNVRNDTARSRRRLSRSTGSNE